MPAHSGWPMCRLAIGSAVKQHTAFPAHLHMKVVDAINLKDWGSILASAVPEAKLAEEGLGAALQHGGARCCHQLALPKAGQDVPAWQVALQHASGHAT